MKKIVNATLTEGIKAQIIADTRCKDLIIRTEDGFISTGIWKTFAKKTRGIMEGFVADKGGQKILFRFKRAGYLRERLFKAINEIEYSREVA